jgi:hypothetical protein
MNDPIKVDFQMHTAEMFEQSRQLLFKIKLSDGTILNVIAVHYISGDREGAGLIVGQGFVQLKRTQQMGRIDAEASYDGLEGRTFDVACRSFVNVLFGRAESARSGIIS